MTSSINEFDLGSSVLTSVSEVIMLSLRRKFHVIDRYGEAESWIILNFEQDNNRVRLPSNLNPLCRWQKRCIQKFEKVARSIHSFSWHLFMNSTRACTTVKSGYIVICYIRFTKVGHVFLPSMLIFFYMLISHEYNTFHAYLRSTIMIWSDGTKRK